jgi:hypothetical protein
MASTLIIINQKGEEVISRHYRSDIPKASIDAFRSKIIASKATGQVFYFLLFYYILINDF